MMDFQLHCLVLSTSEMGVPVFETSLKKIQFTLFYVQLVLDNPNLSVLALATISSSEFLLLQ